MTNHRSGWHKQVAQRRRLRHPLSCMVARPMSVSRSISRTEQFAFTGHAELHCTGPMVPDSHAIRDHRSILSRSIIPSFLCHLSSKPRASAWFNREGEPAPYDATRNPPRLGRASNTPPSVHFTRAFPGGIKPYINPEALSYPKAAGRLRRRLPRLASTQPRQADHRTFRRSSLRTRQ